MSSVNPIGGTLNDETVEQIRHLGEEHTFPAPGEGKRCWQKIPFATENDALTAIGHIAVKAERRGRDTYRRAYPCPHCGRWHITGRPVNSLRSARAYITMLERTVVFLLTKLAERDGESHA